jgi:hypothetical protein
MANLSWNEVRERALGFSRRWADEGSEAAGKQTFWNEFFGVFGRDRRTVAAFEVAVRNLRGDYNYIDLLWRGVLLVEHKSAGKSLAAAESQAFAYIEDLAREGRFDEIPRYVIVSDFARFALFDLEPDEQTNLPLFVGRPYAQTTFPLSELHRFARHFAFLKGERAVRLDAEDPANEKAYALMCQLHDELEGLGFTGTDLEQLLVRLLFCLFADDTGVFEPTAFETYLREHTGDDGSDVGARLNELFEILNTPEGYWLPNSRETFSGFRYINGDLFKGHLRFPPFTRSSRAALLAACEFQWARVSPAVFGSLFQGIMDEKARRQQGAHYTSERDIMKVIRSLFLEELRLDLETAKADSRRGHRKSRLEELHNRLRSFRFLDPACGCGNFLVLGYRELRLLELDLLKALFDDEQHFLDIRQAIRVDVDQFHGIEHSEWPARIAEVAMWLMDHQMNQLVSQMLGASYERLPLKTSPHIVTGNALQLDWRSVLAPAEGVYVMGNPPFVGKHLMTPVQEHDMAVVWGELNGAGFLDYVTAWYKRAAEYIEGSRIRVAFVSTNSITQGEQAGILWGELFQRWRLKIQFAHRTFPWRSEARGAAHVHVVIIGFGAFDVDHKQLYDYEGDGDHVVVSDAKNISPYLIEGPDLALPIRRTPLCEVPEIVNGNKPADGGFLIVSDDERADFLRENPTAEPYLRPFLSAEEYLSGRLRWVLWLIDAPPQVISANPGVRTRVQGVHDFRAASRKESTRRAADYPTLFDQVRQPTSRYVVIPRHSSERRKYIPFGYFNPDVIIGDSCTAIPNADHYHFGVVSSLMHMAWVRTVCGRLKSDIRYSNKLVYNNFPWPDTVDSKQRRAVEAAAERVLASRAAYLAPVGESTLSDLYDPLMMPASLAKCHADLDRAVDRLYRSEPFRSDRERVEHLFLLYSRLSAPLLPLAPSRRTGRRKDRASAPEAPDVKTVFEADLELETESNVTAGAASTSLPGWYLDAFQAQPSAVDRGEVEGHALDLVYERVDDMLARKAYIEVDAFLGAVVAEPSRSSLTALIGLLTVTLPTRENLKNRQLVRDLAHRRLAAAGQNAVAVLRGL